MLSRGYFPEFRGRKRACLGAHAHAPIPIAPTPPLPLPLRANIKCNPAGTPWTLAAYAIEGSANKHCMRSKKMMVHNPEVLHAFLGHLADSLATYICYQIESGAQARFVSRRRGAQPRLWSGGQAASV